MTTNGASFIMFVCECVKILKCNDVKNLLDGLYRFYTDHLTSHVTSIL